MLDKVRLQERAQNVKQLLEHSMFKEAIEFITTQAMAEILAAGSLEELTARAAHARIRALMEVESYLKSIVDDEKVASIGADRKGNTL